MIVWMDIETTGLDFDKDVILEVGMVLSTDELEVIDSRYFVIDTPNRKLKRMIPFVREMHTKSGLLDVLKMRGIPITLRHAEFEFINFMSEHEVTTPALMAGSSIHFDRQFIHKFMPQLEELFTYRMLDVTSVAEVVKRWKPKVYHKIAQKFPKEATLHRTLDDCFESISKLRAYRLCAFASDEHDYLVASGHL